ncbi:hypothetical protein Tco_0524243 [Tanacetum coccineum]
MNTTNRLRAMDERLGDIEIDISRLASDVDKITYMVSGMSKQYDQFYMEFGQWRTEQERFQTWNTDPFRSFFPITTLITPAIMEPHTSMFRIFLILGFSTVKCKYVTRNTGKGRKNEENTNSYEALRRNPYGSVTPLWFHWISFDYRVTLVFGSIVGGLDQVNPVIRLPLELGINRVLGKVDPPKPSVGTNQVIRLVLGIAGINHYNLVALPS